MCLDPTSGYSRIIGNIDVYYQYFGTVMTCNDLVCRLRLRRASPQSLDGCATTA